MTHGAMGAVGSSPYAFSIQLTVRISSGTQIVRTVVIIFAPLTLVHVMVAVYV